MYALAPAAATSANLLLKSSNPINLDNALPPGNASKPDFKLSAKSIPPCAATVKPSPTC